MMCVWAGLAMAAVLGNALAMDLPAAADRALTQAGGGAPGGFRGGTGKQYHNPADDEPFRFY